MVAKGVSPPTLGLWLLICLFRNQERGLPGRAFGFLGHLRCSLSHTSWLFGFAPTKGHCGRDSARFFGLRLSAPSNLLTCPGIFQKARLHSPEGNNLA